MSVLHKPFQRIGGKKKLHNSFYDATIILIPKPENQKPHRTQCPTEKDTKLLTKDYQIRLKYVKRILHHTKLGKFYHKAWLNI